MGLVLRDITDWSTGLSCTPTALAAISGKSPTQIGILLSQVALEHGREIGPDLRPDYNINDWLEVVNRLGGNWAQGEDYSDKIFSERPTIDCWMARRLGPDLELVFCDDGNDIGHVFATFENTVVDTYSNGKVIEFTQIPDSYSSLRVKRAFLV